MNTIKATAAVLVTFFLRIERIFANKTNLIELVQSDHQVNLLPYKIIIISDKIHDLLLFFNTRKVSNFRKELTISRLPGYNTKVTL